MTKELSVSEFIPGYVVSYDASMTGLSSAGGCAVLLRGPLVNTRRCTSTSVEFLDQRRRHKPYSILFFCIQMCSCFLELFDSLTSTFCSTCFLVDFHPKCRSWHKKSGSVHQRVWNTSSWPMMTLFLGRTWKLWTDALGKLPSFSSSFIMIPSKSICIFI